MDEVADSNSVAPTMLRSVTKPKLGHYYDTDRGMLAPINVCRCTHQRPLEAMRKIKALIYALLGGMVAYGYWQRGDASTALFITVFTLFIMGLTLSSIGRMKITWSDDGIELIVFPKKPKKILWNELEKVSLDHLGYHVKASTGQFKIRKNMMPDNLLKRIKENVRSNQGKAG